MQGELLEALKLRIDQRYYTISDILTCEFEFSGLVNIEAEASDIISGGVLDEVSASGEVLKSSHRLWPQTEILKAHSSQSRLGEKEAPYKLVQAIETLRQNHFEAMPDGAWREHIGKRGESLRTDMPGSSLYHLAMAVAEIDAVNDTGITFENR